MEDARLPTHLEISGMIRAAQDKGGFACVLQSGERTAGTLLVLTMHNGENTMVWERMPRLDGRRKFSCTFRQDTEKPTDFEEYIARRKARDPDIWIIELDGPEMERLVESWPG